MQRYKYINIVPVKIQGCNELKCRAAKSLESCEKIQRHRKKTQNVWHKKTLTYTFHYWGPFFLGGKEWGSFVLDLCFTHSSEYLDSKSKTYVTY